MKRSTQVVILAFAGLTLVLSVVSAAFNLPLALGLAAVAGACAVWAAMMSTTDRSAPQAERPEARMNAQVVVPARPAEEAEPLAAIVPPQEGATSVTESVRDSPSDGAGLLAPCLSPEDLKVPLSVEPCDVLESLLRNAGLAGAAIAAHLWLEDVGTPTLRLVCAEGPAQPDPTPVPAAEGVLGAALANEVAQHERFAAAEDDDPTKPQWRYALPLLTDEASGVVAVDFGGITEPDSALMDQVFSAMRGLLMGSLALHVARSEASSARQLLETATDLARLIDPDAVVNSALQHALKLSGAETGSVMLVDPESGKMRIACACGLPEEVVGDTRVAEGEGIAGWVLASGRPLVVEDLDHQGPQSRRHGVLSAASVPISDDDGVLGVLNVGSRRFHARFSRSHVRALEAIGRIAAISVRNARAMTLTQDLFFDTLKALALAMETRDLYTRGGTARILEIATSLGDKLGLGEADAHALRLAALLHDIGMSAAGDGVTATSRPLTTVEWGMLKMHPQIAAEILDQAPALRQVVPIVFHHHERYDGSGYAQGLAGDDIPLGARILSVADAYVAMTSARPYRLAMSAEKAMSELVAGAKSQFDPKVVDALVELTTSDADRFALRS
jgi:GAF domain-containing protein